VSFFRDLIGKKQSSESLAVVKTGDAEKKKGIPTPRHDFGARDDLGATTQLKRAVKSKSEDIIKSLGGGVCDWLPALDLTEPRGSAEVADRALALHALVSIYFGAPLHFIDAWIKENKLETALSRQDRLVLATKQVGRVGDASIFAYCAANGMKGLNVGQS